MPVIDAHPVQCNVYCATPESASRSGWFHRRALRVRKAQYARGVAQRHAVRNGHQLFFVESSLIQRIGEGASYSRGVLVSGHLTLVPGGGPPRAGSQPVEASSVPTCVSGAENVGLAEDAATARSDFYGLVPDRARSQRPQTPSAATPTHRPPPRTWRSDQSQRVPLRYGTRRGHPLKLLPKIVWDPSDMTGPS
jgi:hypothetical protein